MMKSANSLERNKKSVIVLGGLPLATMVTKMLISRIDVQFVGVVLCRYSMNVDPWHVPPLDWFAASQSIPVFTMQELVDDYEEGGLDIAFSCRFSKLMKLPFIRLFKRGIVNMHGGLLPEYGGLYSSSHVVKNREKAGGGTLHLITDERIDSGDIIERAAFPIDQDDTSITVFRKTQKALYSAVSRNIDKIMHEPLIGKPLDKYISEGHKHQYFNASSLWRIAEIEQPEELSSFARAFEFPGHERAYFLDGKTKVYLTTTPVHELELQTKRKWTPIESVHGYDEDIRCKRDDIFPLVGGGNKARKIQYIFKHAVERGYNAIVTNGGIQSNHARATALLAAQCGIKCALVLHTDLEEQDVRISGNYMLMKMSGADITLCSLSQLAEKMDAEMCRVKHDGYKPLYVWGGGHCLEGTLAYYDAAREAQSQCGAWIPDYVICASGTGTTQAGLVAGYAHLPTRVIGVSVARACSRGIGPINDAIKELSKYHHTDYSSEVVEFRDEWTGGGYEKVGADVVECIKNAALNGLILDPTYTGKAFWGLLSMLKKKEIEPESKILFWHTGGLMNLMASPIMSASYSEV